jgi:hypothetical protein
VPAALPKLAAPLSPAVPRNPDPPEVVLSAFWEKLPPIVSLIDRWRPNIEVLRGTLTLTPPMDMSPFLEPIEPIDPMLEDVPGVPADGMKLPPDGDIEKPLLPVDCIPPESRGEENPPLFPLAKDSLGRAN